MTSHTRPLVIDIAVYAGFAAFALATALASTYRTHSTWGAYATAGYLLAAGYAGYLLLRARRPASGRRWESRWVPVGLAFVLGLLAPLVDLVLRRLGGGDWTKSPTAWAAQPEVWVIERSAGLLLHNGTPYVDVHALGRPPIADDYTPYGPVMAVFGLPRALAVELGLGDVPVVLALTDARLWFVATAVGCALLGLRLLGRPSVPVAAAQLAVVCPATALTWAVAGPDLAILGLLVLSLVLAVRGNYLPSAVLLALVVGAKLTAAPAVLVLIVLVAARAGAAKAAAYTGTFALATAVVHVPVVLADPKAFVEHVIAFPAGQGAVESPAASPLPGHLIAETGPVGHTIALVLLGLAAVAIAAWVLLRPPATGADAALRIAVGLGTATLLTPATRWGYIVYPLVLLGARLCFRAEPAVRASPKPPRPATVPTSPASPTSSSG